MAGKRSAGLLLYRVEGGVVQVLLGHMGGPFWARKDAGAWSIPKGEYTEGEDPLAVARREFAEELGSEVPATAFRDLGSVRQSGGKVVSVWAAAGDFDVTTAASNTFSLEWPRGSGRMQDFPEIDRAGWFDLRAARDKLVRGQVGFLDALLDQLRAEGAGAEGAYEDETAPVAVRQDPRS